MRRALSSGAHVAVYALAVLGSLYPLIWMLAVSFQPANAAFELPPKLLFVPELSNYRRVLGDSAFVSSIIDSLAITVPATMLCVVAGALAGYALSRHRIRRQGTLTSILVISRLVPAFAIVIPTFIIYRELDLLDTRVGLILSMAAFQLPIAVLVMYRIIDAIPRSLDEAALIDGAGVIQLLTRVIVPLVKPGLAASTVLTFVLIWNEFLFILVLAGNAVITLPVTIASFETERQILWGPISAASMIAVLPIILLVLTAQRHLLAGLGLGAVRE